MLSKNNKKKPQILIHLFAYATLIDMVSVCTNKSMPLNYFIQFQLTCV